VWREGESFIQTQLVYSKSIYNRTQHPYRVSTTPPTSVSMGWRIMKAVIEISSVRRTGSRRTPVVRQAAVEATPIVRARESRRHRWALGLGAGGLTRRGSLSTRDSGRQLFGIRWYWGKTCRKKPPTDIFFGGGRRVGGGGGGGASLGARVRLHGRPPPDTAHASRPRIPLSTKYDF
jgi:hypothetical protein